MKYLKKLFKNHYKKTFFISLLLHLLLLLLFVFIKIENSISTNPEYSTIAFSEIPAKIKTGKTVINNPVTEKKRRKEKIPDEETGEVKSIESLTDTLAVNGDTSKILSAEADSSYKDLGFAETLLDTFLVRNPSYAKFILQEQAKGIAKRKFSRQVLVKKLNDELHKYLRSKYPEGSDHAPNRNAGPGIQIPIGDLINLVKKIFD